MWCLLVGAGSHFPTNLVTQKDMATPYPHKPFLHRHLSIQSTIKQNPIHKIINKNKQEFQTQKEHKKKKMSVASFSHIKIPNPSQSSSSSSSSFSSSTQYRFSATKPTNFTIRCSQTDGPLRRPSIATPPLRPPTPPSSASPPPPPPPVQSPKPTEVIAVGDKNVITMEFQRQKAKELQDYFKQKKLEEANQGPFFGFIAKNEISNGRWAMFGFAVGMLTEYATGSDFVDQVKILLSNFGILDLD